MEYKQLNKIFLQFLLSIHVLSVGCYNSQVPYKHVPNPGTDIRVDKIVPLESPDKGDDTKLSRANKGGNTDLLVTIELLRSEVVSMRTTQETHRQQIQSLEAKLERYHDEMIVGNAEAVQTRQLVSENYDRTAALEEAAHDNSVALEGLQYLQKETSRDLRRFREYKERAGKRFHQMDNHLERAVKQEETTTHTLKNLSQEIQRLASSQSLLKNVTFHIQDILTTAINTSKACCNAGTRVYSMKSGNAASENSVTNKQREQVTDRHVNSYDQSDKITDKQTNDIEITEFGSGEIQDEYLSKQEEVSNKVTNRDHRTNNKYDHIEYSSGEIEEFGSGDEGSGEIDQLPPIPDIEKPDFVEKTTFHTELYDRDYKISNLLDKYKNMSDHMEKIETRLTSIQLGNFMQSLQESLINFTHNVITLDQWKMSSTQIVNSTVHNQDQIIKLTNMILDNTDKISDLKWKISNVELLSDQQFNILRMYVIRLNNSVEDIKEQMDKLHSPSRPGYQPAYYGYQTGSRPGYPGHQYNPNNHGEQSKESDINIQTLISRLEDIGLQIVFNQNRIGNLEVKFLNESLYTCRKYNMDAYQDSQLAGHESMIKTNTKSILVVHELVNQLDEAVQAMQAYVKVNARRIRTTASHVTTLRALIPAMVSIKHEVDNFRFQLPTDCSEYHLRGSRRSGIYVIHPITAQRSRQVMCHMTQDGGWTVLQQRFNGRINFTKNWTEYKEGFGSADSEYWIGNDNIYLLTSHANYSLQIDMVDIHNNHWSAAYNHFSVAHPSQKYTLSVSGYHGNATDGMGYSASMGFSTPDWDNDASGTNCAFFYESGWWFKHCQTCNLNGRYDIGFIWFDLNTSSWIRLKSSVMRIKSIP